MAGVDLLFGTMLIGVMLNMMLFGSVVTQMFRYFQRFPNDSVWIRLLMAYLLVVQIANVVSECGIIFEPFIIQYGELAAVTVSPKLLPADLVIIVRFLTFWYHRKLTSAPVNSISADPTFLCVENQRYTSEYVRSEFVLTAANTIVITRSYILPGIIALLSMASFGSGIDMSIKVFTNPEFRQFGTFTTTTVVWLALSASCDLVIAIGMSHALYTRRTGFKALDGRINQIIRLTLETGSLTAVMALTDITLFHVFPMTMANFIVNFPLSAVYTCSILAMLNSRESPKPEDLEQAHSAPQILAHSHQLSTFKAAQSALQSSKQFDAGYASST
ncbi:hypothetical protein K438DRAFT_2022408 [Mycena galopus ATCC 62051]|nr:hypothetical protein K438DRAFT_2022408 [Mycena galopus ATCC 62051]